MCILVPALQNSNMSSSSLNLSENQFSYMIWQNNMLWKSNELMNINTFGKCKAVYTYNVWVSLSI